MFIAINQPCGCIVAALDEYLPSGSTLRRWRRAQERAGRRVIWVSHATIVVCPHRQAQATPGGGK